MPPEEWHIGKRQGKVFVSMFGCRIPDGTFALMWEMVEESSLPVNLVRRCGEEYSFILPVGVEGEIIREKVGSTVNVGAQGDSINPTCGGILPHEDTNAFALGVDSEKVTNGGPVEGGDAGHNVFGDLVSSENVQSGGTAATDA